MAEVKISELTSATTPLAGTETVPIVQGGVTKKVAVSEIGGGGGIEWGAITGDLYNQIDLQNELYGKQEILFSGTNIKTINSTSVLGSGNLAVQPTLVSGTNIKTINGNSVLGSGNLVVGGASNPSVVAISAQDGTPITGNGTGTEEIGLSLLVPSGTFAGNGLLELRYRILASGTSGNYYVRIYKNTTSSLTGATLIATPFANVSNLWHGGQRTFTINSNTIKGLNSTTVAITDVNNWSVSESSTTFTTSVNNYIIIALQPLISGTTLTVKSAMLNKYI
jgi:hypothetical protein